MIELLLAMLTRNQRKTLEEVLRTLTPRQEQVIRLYYGIGKKPLLQSEIARMFDLSSDRVRQVREEALRKLFLPNRLHRLRWEAVERKDYVRGLTD